LTEPDKRYLPAYKRAATPPPMQLTERDIEIIRAVYDYRLLSAPQLEALFFPSNTATTHSRRSACQRRLQLLYHHGFLERLPQPVILGQGRAPFVYALAEAGANLVAQQLGLDRAEVGWQPKHNDLGLPFLDHSLGINEVRVVIRLLVEQGQLELEQWRDEVTLKSADWRDKVPYRMEGSRPVRKYPDGYFILRLPATGQRAHFFLEIDQATTTNARWQEKVVAYQEFRQGGQSKLYYGTRNFRVLTVTTGERRLANLLKATEKAGGDHYFWFTTREQVTIWQPERFLEAVWTVVGNTQLQSLFNQ